MKKISTSLFLIFFAGLIHVYGDYPHHVRIYSIKQGENEIKIQKRVIHYPRSNNKTPITIQVANTSRSLHGVYSIYDKKLNQEKTLCKIEGNVSCTGTIPADYFNNHSGLEIRFRINVVDARALVGYYKIVHF
ncbi:MAG: hypothetical protein OXD32_02075 [Endozoicomonadaceae bacterium]|nr:hypothetical protein [Endozoicomonadaceae bacterium]MCY4329258.1 hypothetical protein [Endozoicomonadaceae bacterium]